MRSALLFAATTLFSVAFAQVPEGTVLAAANSSSTDAARGWATSGFPVPLFAPPSQLNGDFRAMAVGIDQRIWSLHSVTGFLTATNDTGLNESFDISLVDSNWSDMVGSDDGRLFISTFDGAVYEVDTADGSLSLSAFSITLSPGTELRNLAAVGNTLYASTGPTNFASSPFVAKRFEIDSGNALPDQTTPYYRGHMWWVFDNGDVLVSDNRDGPFLVRRSADNTTSVFVRPFLGFAVDATVAEDGSLWVLMADDSIHRLDPLTGADLGSSPFITNATNHGSMDAFEAASLLDVQYPVFDPGYDNCPENDQKFDPGVCGCDFYDMPATEFDEPIDDGDVGCVHITATYPESTLIGAGAYVYEYAVVGEESQIADRSIIGARALLGEGVSVGSDSIVSRLSSVGQGTAIDNNVLIGRSVTIGANAAIGPQSSIGYGSTLPDNAEIGEFSTIGSLVDFGSGDVSLGGTLRGFGVSVARGVTFSGDVTLGSGTIIGPDSTFSSNITTGDDVRMRKGVTTLDEVIIGSGTRVGRGVTFAGLNIVGTNADIQPNATINEGICVADDQYVPRAVTLSEGECF